MKLRKDGVVKEVKDEALIKSMIQVGWTEVKDSKVKPKEEDKYNEHVE